MRLKKRIERNDRRSEEETGEGQVNESTGNREEVHELVLEHLQKHSVSVRSK